MRYCSINIVTYHDIDDFGETSASNPKITRTILLKNLIESLEKNTDYPAEINLWDNGGKEEDNTDYLVNKVRSGTINHLIRSKNNVHFAHAWNTLAKISDGDYMAFICNDIELLPGWLSSCVKILEDYPDKRWVSTPFITYDKRRHTIEVTKEGYRVNARSGSNCMVMRRKDWAELGEFPRHRIGGSIWYTKNFRAGWWFVAPEKDLAVDRGWRNGVNFSIPIKVINKLLNGEEIHMEEPIQ